MIAIKKPRTKRSLLRAAAYANARRSPKVSVFAYKTEVDADYSVRSSGNAQTSQPVVPEDATSSLTAGGSSCPPCISKPKQRKAKRQLVLVRTNDVENALNSSSRRSGT